MSNDLLQLKTAYEDLGRTPEEIAETLGWELESVKAGLMTVSVQYRKDCRTEPEGETVLKFSEEQELNAIKVIHDIMMGSEDENLQLKAAMYLRDDRRGRKDAIKDLGKSFQLSQFNIVMQQMRSGAEQVKQMAMGQVVEVQGK